MLRKYLGLEVQTFRELVSTNRYLLDQERPNPGLAVLAIKQTQGRGRLGRVWESGSGGQLTASFLIPTRPWPHFLPCLSLLVGLSILEVLEGLGAKGLSLKWPNDLLWEDRKLAGVLLESRPEYVVAGIGVNLQVGTGEYSFEVKNRLVHLGELGISAKPAELFESILDQTDRRFVAALKELAPLLQDWERRSGSIGKRVRVVDSGLSGTIKGLGPAGQLVLQTEAGQVELVSGEVVFEG